MQGTVALMPTPLRAAGEPVMHSGLVPWDPLGGRLLSPRRTGQWILLFLALGAAARLVRYFLCFPLWCDEGYLAVSFLERDYLGLTQGLPYVQVAPLWYLWIQLSLVKLLGFSELSLRLWSLLCGLASLPLFWHLARRLFCGTTLVLAVAVFSVAYPGIRYSAEAKPYAGDLLVSLILLSLAVEWFRAPHQSRWLWILGAVSPLLLGLSYPSVFVAGAVSLAIGWQLWRKGTVVRDADHAHGAADTALSRACPRKSSVAWVAFNLAVGAGFLAFYLVTVHSQSANCLEADQKFWKDQFPPLAEFWRLPGWLLESHAGDMLAHPVGGRNYGSSLTLIGCVAALVVLARRKQAALVILLLAPFAFNFLAAALHRYPYGGHVRIAMHLAPIVCLLVSLGLSLLVRRCVERRPSLRPLPVALVGLLLLPIASMTRDVGHPYRSASDLEIREFSRWFWTAAAEDAELVCMKTDLGIDFPLGGKRDDDSALYLCNQRIYSPRHARGERPHLDQVCPARPLRCVRFNSTRSPQDPQAWEKWLRQMQNRYGHASRQCYEFPIRTRQGRVVYVQQVETLDFRPRGNLVGLAAMPRRPAESPERAVR